MPQPLTYVPSQQVDIEGLVGVLAGLTDADTAEASARAAADTNLQATKAAVTQLLAGFWGDGSDGTVTISGTVTLARDMFYDTLIVPTGIVLFLNNFRLFCRTLCQVNAGGIIHNDGASATSSTGGLITANTLGAASSGGAGGTTAGTASTSVSAHFGGAGGNGGSGTAGAGGAAATNAAPAANFGAARSLPQAAMGHLQGTAFSFFRGGSSGGGGGGDIANTGGGAGQGGGICLINARRIINNGTIRAKGGNGFTPTAGNTGGGGAGGGGVVLINSTEYTGTGTLDASAGVPGNGIGTGTAGAAGTAGQVRNNVWG